MGVANIFCPNLFTTTPSLGTRKRARSRSFQEIKESWDSEAEGEHTDQVDEFGCYGSYYKKYEFSPVDHTICLKYADKRTLYEDTISPSVVTLVEEGETGKVSYNRILSPFKMFLAIFHQLLAQFVKSADYSKFNSLNSDTHFIHRFSWWYESSNLTRASYRW